jgi:hypothetical protein
MKAKGNDQSRFWYIVHVVNGARQKTKKKVNLAGYRTRVARFVVGPTN